MVLASRNESKGAQMLSNIRARPPAADVSFEPLDLASLKSVEAFSRPDHAGDVPHRPVDQ